MTTQLIEIPKETALEVFTTDNGLDPYIQLIKDELKSFVPDLRTAKSRAEIASKAAKISKFKVYFDREGKRLTDELKAKPKLIDAERKRTREILDALRDEVRKPLTDWETAETARTDVIKERITRMQSVPEIEAGSGLLKSHLSKLELTDVDDSFGEFKGDAAIAKDKAILETKKNLEIAVKRETEKAELERLQKEAAEREQKEREEKLVKEAEERARKQAEYAAQAKINEAKAAEEKARLAALEADKRAQDAKEAEAKRTAQIEEDKKQAELLAQKRIDDAKKEEAERIEKDARMMREIEAAKKRDAEAAEKRRVEDVANREKILDQVANSLSDIIYSASPDEPLGKVIAEAIAEGKIENVTINY